jgi:predicted TIM-barrel fold metal-dependent hydrolase
MGRAVMITRMGLSGAELRRVASRSKDGQVVRRLLALALILEGHSREEAASLSGMQRQTLRDWVKLSGYAKFSREPWPHRDTWPFVLALKAAFGVERCLWASDWPFIRAPERVDYGPLVRLVAMLFPARDERAQVFWGNAAELFGFEAVG